MVSQVSIQSFRKAGFIVQLTKHASDGPAADRQNQCAIRSACVHENTATPISTAVILFMAKIATTAQTIATILQP